MHTIPKMTKKRWFLYYKELRDYYFIQYIVVISISNTTIYCDLDSPPLSTKKIRVVWHGFSFCQILCFSTVFSWYYRTANLLLSVQARTKTHFAVSQDCLFGAPTA